MSVNSRLMAQHHLQIRVDDTRLCDNLAHTLLYEELKKRAIYFKPNTLLAATRRCLDHSSQEGYLAPATIYYNNSEFFVCGSGIDHHHQ